MIQMPALPKNNDVMLANRHFTQGTEPFTLNGLTVRQILVKAAQRLAAKNDQEAFWLVRTAAEHANEVELRTVRQLQKDLRDRGVNG